MKLVLIEEFNMRCHLSNEPYKCTRVADHDVVDVDFRQRENCVEYRLLSNLYSHEFNMKFYGKLTLKTMAGVTVKEMGGKYANSVANASIRFPEDIPVDNVGFQYYKDEYYLHVTNHLGQKYKYLIACPLQDIIFVRDTENGFNEVIRASDDNGNSYPYRFVNLCLKHVGSYENIKSSIGETIEGFFPKDESVTVSEQTILPIDWIRKNKDRGFTHIDETLDKEFHTLSEIRGMFYQVFD